LVTVTAAASVVTASTPVVGLVAVPSSAAVIVAEPVFLTGTDADFHADGFLDGSVSIKVRKMHQGGFRGA
jgi:hypothetical protein